MRENDYDDGSPVWGIVYGLFAMLFIVGVMALAALAGGY